MNNNKFFFTLFAVCFSVMSFAQSEVRVRGYIKSNGTYVEPYIRTAPDHIFYNNWSTKGNINPYTLKEGTKLYPSYSPLTPYKLPNSYKFPTSILDNNQPKLPTSIFSGTSSRLKFKF